MTRSLWVAVAAAGLALAACGGSDDNNNGGGTTPTKPTACTPPATATVKFSTDVHPILVSSCGTCHGDAGTLPKFGSADIATSYTAVKADVDTTTPASSKLLVKGQGGSSHAGGAPLSSADAAKIQQWITECAQNN